MAGLIGGVVIGAIILVAVFVCRGSGPDPRVQERFDRYCAQ